MEREEIIKDIRTLLEGIADTGTKIGISWENPDLADVFLNGEYFNTYIVSQRKFLRNVKKNDTDRKELSATIVISRDDLREKYEGYKGAQLQLPATVNELRDALLRARITASSQTYTVTEFSIWDKDISDSLMPEDNMLRKLNYLVKRINELDEETQKVFKGIIESKGMETFTLTDLINMSYNLDGCAVYYGVENDEQLGKFYVDNGMVEWLKTASEEVRKYLDYEMLGREIRESENGTYMEEGYVSNKSKEYRTVYDGVTFPERLEGEDYFFRVCLLRAGEGQERRSVWLNLPLAENALQDALSALGVTSIEECYLNGIESPETKIPMCVSSVNQLDKLNEIARKVYEMRTNGELAKFRAILEAMQYDDLQEVIGFAENLDSYILYTELSNKAEYARALFENEYRGVLKDDIIRYIDFRGYAEDVLAEEAVYVTEYGILKKIIKE